MKFKRTQIISLFLAGALLFSAVAVADTIMGSGYGGAKSALKRTTKTLANKTGNFTAYAEFEVKFDGELLTSEKTLEKYDLKNNKSLFESSRYSKKDGESGRIYYSDNEKSIHKSKKEDIYHQYNRSNPVDMVLFSDPFEEEYAADVEKVADAFVSNMKDFVQISEEGEGKLYYSSMDGSQLPAFVSALSSVFLKYSLIEGYHRELNAEAAKEVYITEASCKAFENADGILENGLATLKAVSVEESGAEHTWEISMSMELYDLNKTVVEVPEMNGNVEIENEKEAERYGVMYERDLGVYKGDIVEKTDSAYIKKGEAHLRITSVSDKEIAGHITCFDDTLNIDTDFTARFNNYYSEYIAEVKTGEETRYLSFSNCDSGNMYNASITMEANIEQMIENGQGKVYFDKDGGMHKIMLYKVFE